MSVSIVISNRKGGVGKTMFAGNLAEYGVEKRGRVLVVDVDGQGNTTRYLIGDRAERSKRASMLYDDGETPVPVQVRDNVRIIPADRALNDVEALPAKVVQSPRKQLAKLAGDFDMVVIDTPPSKEAVALLARLWRRARWSRCSPWTVRASKGSRICWGTLRRSATSGTRS